MTARKPRRGDKVRIERDEDLHPAKGTWPRFRGRTGTVVSVNNARTVKVREGKGSKTVRIEAEYGVNFGKVYLERSSAGRVDAWFREHELVTL